MKEKKILYLISGITVCIFVIGVSFAFWYLNLEQTTPNVVTSGCFSMEFTEGNAISLNDAYPVSDEEGMKLTPYTFTLTNDGDLDLYISLYLEKDTTPGLNYTVDGKQYIEAVEENQIKVAIGEDGSTPTIKNYSDTLVGENHVIASNILIPSGETKIFHLYSWLTSDASNASQGKYFVTQISARGEYLPAE